MGKNSTNFMRYTQMGKNNLKSAILGNYGRQKLKSTLIDFFFKWSHQKMPRIYLRGHWISSYLLHYFHNLESNEINPQAIYVLERYDLKPFSLGNVVSCVIISTSRLSGPPQPINCKSNYESFVKVKKSKENPRRRNV